MDLDYQIGHFAVFLSKLVIKYLREIGRLDELHVSTLVNKSGKDSIKQFLLSLHPSQHISKFFTVTTFEHFETKLLEIKSSIEFKSGHSEFYEKCARIITLGHYFGDRHKQLAENKDIDGLVSAALQDIIKSAIVAGHLDEYYDNVRKFVKKIVQIIRDINEEQSIDDEKIPEVPNLPNDLLDYIKEQKARTLLEPESCYLEMNDEKLDFLLTEMKKWHENRLRETQNEMLENLKYTVDIAYIAIWFYEQKLNTWYEIALDKLTEFIILRGRQHSTVCHFTSALAKMFK